MSRTNNFIKIEGNVAIILITKDDDASYLKKVLVDTEDLPLLGKVYCNKRGYAKSCMKYVAHIVMKHTSNMINIVDHINCNRLDNRKENLRILTQHENSTNKSFSKSNIGIVGISKRKNGSYEYFRATCSDLENTVIEKGQYGGRGRATKRYSKQFNINKLGEEQALIQAKEWLEQKRKEFGYSRIS